MTDWYNWSVFPVPFCRRTFGLETPVMRQVQRVARVAAAAPRRYLGAGGANCTPGSGRAASPGGPCLVSPSGAAGKKLFHPWKRAHTNTDTHQRFYLVTLACGELKQQVWAGQYFCTETSRAGENTLHRAAPSHLHTDTGRGRSAGTASCKQP